MSESIVVIDPGHGGVAPIGRSTPIGHSGPGDVEEKTVCLAVARAARDALEALGVRALLTRDDDRNLSLRERAEVARAASARVFLSLHFCAGEGSPRGPRVWLHDDDHPGPVALGEALVVAIASVEGAGPADGVGRGPLAVLTPSAHAPDCAACLVELGRLDDQDAARWVVTPHAQQALGAAIARAVASWCQGPIVEAGAAPAAPADEPAPPASSSDAPATADAPASAAPPSPPRRSTNCVGLHLVEVRR